MSVSIMVKIKRHTERAVLVDHGGEDMWLPKSQIESPIPSILGAECELVISDWIADQKDLTASAVERYIVESSNIATMLESPVNYAVKDTSTNPIHIMCICGNARDANIICASLEMTKNKL